MVTFVSDLDGTLIYPQESLHDSICVEKYQGRDISFVTKKSYRVLNQLLSSENIKFIPCTARSHRQMTRISFFEALQLEYAICDLGASIYYNGKKDVHWEDYLISTGIVYPEKMNKFASKVSESFDLPGCKKIVSNDDYFYIFSFYNHDSMLDFYNRITNYYQEGDILFHHSRTKVYCYPRKLNKSLAVTHLLPKIESSYTITSGDSLFDHDFSELGNLAVLPGHAVFKTTNAVYCKDCGIMAGERILTCLEALLHI